MRIGIFVSVLQNSGGMYQYTASILKALHDWDTDHEFVIVRSQGNQLPLDDFSGSRWSILTIDPQMARCKNVAQYLSGDGLDLICSNINPEMEKVFKDHRIELVISPRPVNFFFEWGVPYIMAIHDLQHRLQPHFPEVSAGGIWKSREYLFRNGVRYAENILVDSEVGKEDVLNFYGDYISPDQVRPLPFLPFYRPDDKEITEAGKRQVQKKYSLPDDFLFYPAQFWLHKNHSRLIHAVHILRSVHKIDAPLVLVGSNSGGLEGREVVFNNAMLLAEQLGVKDLVRYIGYVPDNDMPFLYSMAKALTMPTFFGPTNIPFLEAWAFGCPVLTSNIRGIREQVEIAGLLVDPENAYEMAEGILKLWTDNGLVRTLVAAGHEKISSYTSDDFARRLYKIIEDVRGQIQTGRSVEHEKIDSDAAKITALNQQGEDLFEKGDLEGALRCFSNALEIDPKTAIVHNNIGVLYYTQGDKEKALHHYEKAAEIEPQNSNFRKNLADFYHVELGRTKEALEIYLQILTDDPTDIETLLILGHICVSLGKMDDASVLYNKVLEFEPSNANARERLDELGRGIDDPLIGGFDDSGRDGRRRTEDGDQESEVRGQGRDIDDSLLGGFDDWGRDGGRRPEVRSQGPEVGERTDGWMNGGLDDSGKERDRDQGSEVGGQRSEISGQGGSDGWMSTNHLMIELSNQRGGIGSPEELYQTAQGFMEGGREKEAIGALKVFLAVYPDYALAHNDLGVLYYNEGEKEKALKHYAQAAQLEPNNLTFQKNLADFYYFELDRVEEAVKVYYKILEKNPEDLETLLVMGHICIKLDKIDDALDFFNGVLEIDPGNENAIEVLRQVQKTVS